MQTGLGQEQSRERRAVAASLENVAEELASKGGCAGKGSGVQMEPVSSPATLFCSQWRAKKQETRAECVNLVAIFHNLMILKKHTHTTQGISPVVKALLFQCMELESDP